MANSSPAPSDIAVDASFVVRVLQPVEQAASTLDQFAIWRQARVDNCAPDFLIAEVTSLIQQAVYREWITAVEDFFCLGVRIITSDLQMCSSALTWAGRLWQSKAYDGFYFALTEQVAGEL
jgi:predicted nucleic acid-binding protein